MIRYYLDFTDSSIEQIKKTIDFAYTFDYKDANLVLAFNNNYSIRNIEEAIKYKRPILIDLFFYNITSELIKLFRDYKDIRFHITLFDDRENVPKDMQEFVSAYYITDDYNVKKAIKYFEDIFNKGIHYASINLDKSYCLRYDIKDEEKALAFMRDILLWYKEYRVTHIDSKLTTFEYFFDILNNKNFYKITRCEIIKWVNGIRMCVKKNEIYSCAYVFDNKDYLVGTLEDGLYEDKISQLNKIDDCHCDIDNICMKKCIFSNSDFGCKLQHMILENIK